MVKKVQMYAEKIAARYDPHSNPVWGSSPPTTLSKVGKCALGNEETRVACKSLRSASQDLHVTRVLWFPNANKEVYFNP